MIFFTALSTHTSGMDEEEGVDDAVLEGFGDDVADALDGDEAPAAGDGEETEDDDEEGDALLVDPEEDADEVVVDSYDDQDDI